MKNKYLVPVSIFFLAAALTTCGNGLPGLEEDSGLKTWTWTEGAFALKISGRGDYPRNGDSFTWSHMGRSFSGNIEREENSARYNSQDFGNRSSYFLRPPGGEPPFEIIPDKNERTIYFEDPRIKGTVNLDGLIVDVTLPEPVGVDETVPYTQGNIKTWTFNRADRTYSVRFDWPPGYEQGVEGRVDYETGSYSWDNVTKTLFLLPQRQAEDYYGGTMRTKEETMAYLPAAMRVEMTDADVPGMTNNRYKTINEFVIAYINQAYGPQVYTYETNGGSFTKFTRNFATTLDHDENAKTIGGLKYTGTPVTSDTFGTIHYRLETTNFDNAAAKLTAQLGAPSDEKPLKDSSTLTVGTNWIILEDCAIYDTYRLAYYSLNEYLGEGFQWPRTNIGGD